MVMGQYECDLCDAQFIARSEFREHKKIPIMGLPLEKGMLFRAAGQGVKDLGEVVLILDKHINGNHQVGYHSFALDISTNPVLSAQPGSDYSPFMYDLETKLEPLSETEFGVAEDAFAQNIGKQSSHIIGDLNWRGLYYSRGTAEDLKPKVFLSGFQRFCANFLKYMEISSRFQSRYGLIGRKGF